MAEKELAIKRLQQRHDTAQNWKVKNPILAEGEIGVETDTGNIKAGNGTTTWNSLPYSNAGLDGGSGGASYLPMTKINKNPAPYVVDDSVMEFLGICMWGFLVYDPAVDGTPQPSYFSISIKNAKTFIDSEQGVFSEGLCVICTQDDIIDSNVPTFVEPIIYLRYDELSNYYDGFMPMPQITTKPFWVLFMTSFTPSDELGIEFAKSVSINIFR